ncbi:alpha/beta fold hydrolase [Aspergillus stella-maris]|uniref:alpha/beta fold hydrolase n=1 Tax=Aspergillus stella-maris TaxID=1810926 RepID=UPI003CCD01B7
MSNGGFNGPVKAYKSLMRDYNAADEEAIPPLKAAIPCPVLLLTASKDPVGLPDSQISNTTPYAADIRVKAVNAGHFLQVEKPDEISQGIHDFVRDVMGEGLCL